MKKTMIYLILFLMVGCVASYQYELDSSVGGVIKYKNVDRTREWIELGIEHKHRNKLIYVPLEYDTIYRLGDTIKREKNELKETE